MTTAAYSPTSVRARTLMDVGVGPHVGRIGTRAMSSIGPPERRASLA